MIIKYEGPYSKNSKSNFSFSKNENIILQKLNSYFDEAKGIHILYGNRGIGKTSIKNRAVELQENENKIIIDIKNYSTESSLLKDSLFTIENWLVSKIEELENKINKKLQDISIFNNFIERRIYIHLENPNKNSEEDFLRRDGFFDFYRRSYKVISKWKRFEKVLNKSNFRTGNVKEQFDYIEEELQRSKILFGEHTFNIKNQYHKILLKKHKYDLVEFREKISYLDKELNYLISKTENYIFLCGIEQNTKKQILLFDKEIISVNEQIFENIDMSENILDSSESLDILISPLHVQELLVTNVSKHKKISKSNKQKKIMEEKRNHSTKMVYTFAQKKDAILNLIQEIAKKYQVCILLDELDKFSSQDVKKIIYDNKRLFVDSNIFVLLIMDTYTYLSIQSLDYIHNSSTILVPSLSFESYYLKATNTGRLSKVDFHESIELFLQDKANTREMIKNDDTSKFIGWGYLYLFFQSSSFYTRLTEINKEIFSNFFIDLLVYLKQVDGIDENEYDDFVEAFLDRNNISDNIIKTLFKRLKKLISTNELLHQINHTFYWLPYNFREKIQKYTSKLNVEKDIFCSDPLKQYFLSIDTLVLQDLSYTLDNIFTEIESDKNIQKKILESFDLKVKNSINNKSRFRFAKEEEFPLDGQYNTTNAQNIINQYPNQIAGVIIFKPSNPDTTDKTAESTLYNGVVLRDHLDELIGYGYVGYPGFHSYSPKRLKLFIRFLQEKGVRYYITSETENSYFNQCFNYGNKQHLEEAIRAVLEKNIKIWSQNLEINFNEKKRLY
ncbi:hypothetical protein [Lactococcus petauri]|uniref:hypothetical protein n=1 Tax=Lactococcus petauri TaxID=1940789 RepID=UPI0038549505